MKQKVKISKELKLFLKKEGVLKEFEDNVRANSYYYGYTINDVDLGFSWRDTPQGFKFWSLLWGNFRSI